VAGRNRLFRPIRNRGAEVQHRLMLAAKRMRHPEHLFTALQGIEVCYRRAMLDAMVPHLRFSLTEAGARWLEYRLQLRASFEEPSQKGAGDAGVEAEIHPEGQ
jgi:hypothetical protein